MVRQSANHEDQEVEEMISEPHLYIRHIRAAKLCMSGARQWFARQGWSWTDFLREGRPVADFEQTGCPLAARAVVFARAEYDNGR